MSDEDKNLYKVAFYNTLFVYGVLVGSYWYFVG